MVSLCQLFYAFPCMLCVNNDKRNVAIHEFAYLIDIADGDCDGLPRELSDNAFCLPWLNLVE